MAKSLLFQRLDSRSEGAVSDKLMLPVSPHHVSMVRLMMASNAPYERVDLARMASREQGVKFRAR
ncbi:hypothetical protein XI05_09660 [Bradyrhizobium sp. CCBAU 11357]|nr:hypothetical protein [Bradyrhizobium sp. CCBAU 11357]